MHLEIFSVTEKPLTSLNFKDEAEIYVSLSDNIYYLNLELVRYRKPIKMFYGPIGSFYAKDVTYWALSEGATLDSVCEPDAKKTNDNIKRKQKVNALVQKIIDTTNPLVTEYNTSFKAIIKLKAESDKKLNKLRDSIIKQLDKLDKLDAYVCDALEEYLIYTAPLDENADDDHYCMVSVETFNANWRKS